MIAGVVQVKVQKKETNQRNEVTFQTQSNQEYSGPTLLSSFWYWGIFFSIWDSSFMVVWNTQIRRPNHWSNWKDSVKTSCTQSKIGVRMIDWSSDFFGLFLVSRKKGHEKAIKTFFSCLVFLKLLYIFLKSTSDHSWICNTAKKQCNVHSIKVSFTFSPVFIFLLAENSFRERVTALRKKTRRRQKSDI